MYCDHTDMHVLRPWYMHYGHSTCMYHGHRTCMYYCDTTCMSYGKRTYMYYGHSTCMYSCPLAVEAGVCGAKPSWRQVGLGCRRPPRDRCVKLRVGVYILVRLLNAQVTKSKFRLVYNISSGCQVSFSWLRFGHHSLASTLISEKCISSYLHI